MILLQCTFVSTYFNLFSVINKKRSLSSTRGVCGVCVGEGVLGGGEGQGREERG